jgi:Spy/CpxP family protein refolding chaperone
MTRKILTVLATAGVAALGVTGVGYAQRTGAGADTVTAMRGMHEMSGMPAMMSMMRDCPMMQGMAHGPAGALKHRDSLGLSENQVQKLEAIRARAGETRDSAMERMQALHREIASVSGADRFDEGAARRAFPQRGAAHADMGVAMLRARYETRETLTPEQREKLARLSGGMMGMQGMQGMSGMMEMMGGEMGGMMGMTQHCPMMQGMMKGGMDGMRMQRPDSTPMPRENQV